VLGAARCIFGPFVIYMRDLDASTHDGPIAPISGPDAATPAGPRQGLRSAHRAGINRFFKKL